MDEVNIVSKFTRMAISKLLKMVLRKKLGYNIDIQLNEVNATITDGNARIHLDVDTEIPKNELAQILKSIGC